MESSQKPYTQLPDSLDMEPLPQGATVVPVPPAALPATPPPRDFLAWSLGSLMYFNCCCLGLMAVIFSIKARDRKMLGDHSGALSYGSTAKGLNIAALALSLIIIIIVIAIMASIMSHASMLSRPVCPPY